MSIIDNHINNFKNVYFIGIGGIGMSALARYFQFKGATVSGYDRTETALTKELQQSGINIMYNEDVDALSKDADLIVYTPAIPASNKLLQFYLTNNNYKVVKRSDVLQWLTESSFNICVGGTHGKTTTSTMIAHILKHTGYGCNAFLGGIAANYNTNFLSDDKDVCVIEADEYDRSFLKLSPDIAIITAMDADHLDIYGTAEEVENAYIQFSHKIKTNGTLICKHGLKRDTDLYQPKKITYSLNNEQASVHAANIKVINGSYVFDIIDQDWTIKDINLHMGGLHNIENCVAAMAVAKLLKISDDKIKLAVETFAGVKRRFEYAIKNDKHVLIDDYAHHPEELKALITGVRSLYTNKKITVVFQPHLFSRTNDLAAEFAESLSLADEIILLPIYPARELPMPGVTSDIILQKINSSNKQLLNKDEMKQWMADNKPGLVVMAGAGDIDVLVNDVKNILLDK